MAHRAELIRDYGPCSEAVVHADSATYCRDRAAAALPAGAVKPIVRYTEAPEPASAASGPQDGAKAAYEFDPLLGWVIKDWSKAQVVGNPFAAITPIAASLDRASTGWLRDGTGEQPGAEIEADGFITVWPAVDSGVGGA
jgi:hypothetical protein